MRKRRIIVALGILVAIMPFLGFPVWVEIVFFVAAGLIIAALAFVSAAPDSMESVRRSDLPISGDVLSDERKNVAEYNMQ